MFYYQILEINIANLVMIDRSEISVFPFPFLCFQSDHTDLTFRNEAPFKAISDSTHSLCTVTLIM